MGTRADFYVGRGEDAEWLGSIAWDGYPEGIDQDLLAVAAERAFRTAAERFLKARDDGTLPDMGWPWPWETSHTTDFAYAFDAGQVWASCFGRPWQPAVGYDNDDETPGAAPVFPDMSDRKNLTLGKRSGVIVVSAPMSEDQP